MTAEKLVTVWRSLAFRLALAVGLAFAIGIAPVGAEPLPGGSLDPTSIPKYREPMIIPPEMPDAGTINEPGGKKVRYYEIEVVEFDQQILPGKTRGRRGNKPFPTTTVWSYAAVGHPETRNYPAFTIEAKVNQPTRVKWFNNLIDEQGGFLTHLLAVDQTLH